MSKKQSPPLLSHRAFMINHFIYKLLKEILWDIVWATEIMDLFANGIMNMHNYWQTDYLSTTDW